MLVLENVTKIYQNRRKKLESFVSLKNINITFPMCGFVSVLGPSGCGKTTLLNILGGLDTNYTGNFIVDGVNTKTFKKNDWDAYRNAHIGFVFQEYNLIPHQNVSKNVELVLTIAGAAKHQIKENAKNVLSNVGLENKFVENVNNLSGGQKQRVAIARALVNNPQVILADEPTSALDTNTSKQVLDILKEISKTKLVIMVTHNTELAKQYSSTIINMLDGKITSIEDFTKPSEKEEFLKKFPQTYQYSKSKMKFLTAANLSLKNLVAKKRRTFLTVLAGSVGIICLSIILGISNGAINYVTEMNRKAEAHTPITITENRPCEVEQDNKSANKNSNDNNNKEKENSQNNNNSKSTEDDKDKIKNPNNAKNLTKAERVYNKDYYYYDSKKEPKKYDLSPSYCQHVMSLFDKYPDIIKAISFRDVELPNVIINVDGKLSNSWNFKWACQEMPVVKSLDDCFELVGKKSRFPSKMDEVVLVLDKDSRWYSGCVNELKLGDKEFFSPDDFIDKEIGIVPMNNDFYKKQGGEYIWPKYDDEKLFEEVANKSSSIKLKCVGVIKPRKNFYKEDSSLGVFDTYYKERFPLHSGIAYTRELGDFMRQNIKNSDVVKDQLASDYDVFKYEYATKKIKLTSEDKLQRLHDLGYYSQPSTINIFLKDPGEHKDIVTKYLESYNEGRDESLRVYANAKNEITTSVNNIKKVCFFLMCTIGLASLLSSLIMVALLTFISVLERTKEIGVLRSIGARKKDISRLFKAEALTIGLFTGIFGVGLGFLLEFPINNFIRKYSRMQSLNLVDINLGIALCLMTFSVFVTLLAGLIPAKIASRKDPVKILTGSNN